MICGDHGLLFIFSYFHSANAMHLTVPYTFTIYIIFLLLEGNQLTGTVPESLCAATRSPGGIVFVNPPVCAGPNIPCEC